MNGSVLGRGTWLKPLGDVFLGLDASAVIRRVFGDIEIASSPSAARLPDLTWRDFVAQYADETAQDGLNYAWLAMAKGCVARAYWPHYLPFKQGVIARMRPVEGDPDIAFVIHLSPVMEYNLVDLIGDPMLDVLDHMATISQRIFRGVGGPLADRQVKDMDQLVSHIEHTRQLLHDLRAEVLLPAATAPLPHAVADLFMFAVDDFFHRRITTHRLTIQSDLSGETVYCQPVMRDIVFHMLGSLLAGITTESAITIADALDENAGAVRIALGYQSRESALQVESRIDPLDVSDPVRLGGMRLIESLVTAAQSRLAPVNGRAWAEPISGREHAARIILVLPRWKGERLGS
jgi:hypothetical protein